MLGHDLSGREQEQLKELLGLERVHLKSMYRKLPCPELGAVNGEYDAQLLDQGDRFANYITRVVFSSKGPWLGKAFRPVDGEAGEGYNAFGTVEDRNAQLRMDTYIDRSLIGNGDSYILDYRKRNRGPIWWLRGELRQVSNSILLGMGAFGPRRDSMKKLRRIIPFVLVRSDRTYLRVA